MKLVLCFALISFGVVKSRPFGKYHSLSGLNTFSIEIMNIPQ